MLKMMLFFFLVTFNLLALNSIEFENLRELANSGDVNAQTKLGNYYFQVGDKPSYLQAVFWYEKAAKKNRASALFNLGICYDQGLGVIKDELKAIDFYKKSANLGIDLANLNLGVIFAEKGQKELAKKYFNLSAEKNNEVAMRRLGLLENDFLWLEKAANLGDEIAMLEIARNFATINPQKTVAILEKLVKMENAEACLRLGFCYQKGFGIGENLRKSTELFEKSMQLGNDLGKLEYAKILFLQKNNIKIALKYLKELAEKENMEAIFYCGSALFNGFGEDENLQKGFLLFEKAAKMGFAQAQFNTAMCFENGLGIEQSLNMAAFWYEKATEQNNLPALLALAQFYYLGTGVNLDFSKSKELLKKAESLNSTDAKKLLKELF